MTIEQMKTAVVRKFGFEHPATIYFFDCCSLPDNDQLLAEICFEFAMGWVEDGE